jgi:hypothetical protein
MLIFTIIIHIHHHFIINLLISNIYNIYFTLKIGRKLYLPIFSFFIIYTFNTGLGYYFTGFSYNGFAGNNCFISIYGCDCS